jgi:hypothetical protein
MSENNDDNNNDIALSPEDEARVASFGGGNPNPNPAEPNPQEVRPQADDAVDPLTFNQHAAIDGQLPAINGAASYADPNMGIFHHSLAALDVIDPSIIHTLQYQQMLYNMRLIQFLSQDATALQQVAYETSAVALQYPTNIQGWFPQAPAAAGFPFYNNSTVTSALATIQGGISQVPITSSMHHLPNVDYPIFHDASAAGGTAASVSRRRLPIFDPNQEPQPPLESEEDNYDVREEERKPYGQRCLLYLVDERHWVEALQRISTHPEEAAMVGMQARYPIHVACDHDAPAFLVHALLSVWPHGAFMVGTSFMNPLHITCSSQHASNEIVNLLLAGCGDPLRITRAKDVDGDTPLHAACRCAAPIDVLVTLLQINPEVVMWYDFEGLNPILRLWVRYYVLLGNEVISSIECASDLTPDLMRGWQKSLLLLRVMNEVERKNSGKQLPVPFLAVHCASALECPRCVLRIATILYPGQLMISDEDGFLPLHIATKAPVYVSSQCFKSPFSTLHSLTQNSFNFVIACS